MTESQPGLGRISALPQASMGATERPADSHRALSTLLAPVLLLALTTISSAQSTLDKLRQHDKELEAVRQQQRQIAETEARLKREIGSLGDDRRRLNQALIDAASRLRAIETRVAETEARLKPLDDNERGIRQSLDGRRAVIAEVLASLQRIGRNPPPAMMVRPEDALTSIRTAIMLGAVLPEMRVQADSLAADLADLARIRREIAEEKGRLQRDIGALAEERQRITLLIDGRQKKQAETERAIEAEKQKAAALARQVDNLKDLIGKIEQGLDSATRAARVAARTASEEKALNGRIDLAALKDPGRLTPAVAFASARGHLPLPVNGVRIREFGAADSLGGSEKGLTIATRGGAQVTAPCDGWVVYAAPFRNYGQVLILNAGGGYHVVLAGMERISVDVGQFVLTGEPVATMGSGSQVAATLASGSNQPVLYVEFRKDGTPVDPSPWWAASEGEKVRG
jgi:septal ring factor EnvC (AmiA/AmiB activator)